MYSLLLLLLLYFSGVLSDTVTPKNDLISQVNMECTFSTNGKFEVLNASDTTKGFRDLNNVLSSDYGHLTGFSKAIKTYGITEESFKKLFWKGAIASFDFQQSPECLKQSSINHLITTELLSHADLEHPLKSPEITETNLSIAFKALNKFSGEWHGNWETMKVHHLWLPVRELKMSVTEEFTLMGFQSCFTGDGFGWNYVVKEKNTIRVLGFVYHFNTDGKILSKNPHYAFLNTNSQLTWVSDNHIYYEFICTQSNCTENKHYVITGAHYEKQKTKLKLISAFQAIYLSKNQQLPIFKQLHVHSDTHEINQLLGSM